MAQDRRDPDSVAASALAQVAQQLLAQSGGDPSYGGLKRGFREALLRDPLDSILVTVLGGSYLFYLAEKGRNPKCESFFDALAFITTSMSVGYDDVFARTDSGKAIASFVMTFGPALAAGVLAPPSAENAEKAEQEKAAAAEARETDRAILERLDQILAALRDAPVPTPARAPEDQL